METYETKIEKGEERPWLNDKRSWIFYIDQIEKNENMIHKETNDSVFVFDCATAHLLIWSKKWEAFTEVGISSLLKRVSSFWGENDKSELEGTRIFYKGIELKNHCLADDTELLEYIDIKGGLEGRYININRRGFTDEGERYFEEKLYPGLLETIQKVLKELGTSADETGFVGKVHKVVGKMGEEIIKELADEERRIKKKQDLISLVGNIAVLAYLAMRDEWNIWEKVQKERLQNKAWEDLLKDLDKTLAGLKNGEMIQELGAMTALFNIRAYTSKYRPRVERGERRHNKENDINFLKIFAGENGWAILQWRRNRYSTWIAYLISLEGDMEPFRKLSIIPRLEDDEPELENWGISLCDISNTIMPEEGGEIALDNKQQFLLKWMLKNIPTIGLFCNEQGNVRVNVLSGRILPSIYMNRNFKCLILERMMEKAQKDSIQRFSTMAWQGRESISCVRLPFAIYFIKRGYLSEYSYHKCIVPVEGRLLSEWKNALDGLEYFELTQKVGKLLEDMNIFKCLQEFQQEEKDDEYKETRKYLRGSETNAILEISTFFLDVVLKDIVDNNFKMRYSIEELLKLDEKRSERWRKIFYIMAKIYAMVTETEYSEEEVDKLREELWEDDGIDSLGCAWLYCCLFRNDIIQGRSKIREQYKEYTVNFKTEISDKREKMVEYIRKEGYCIDVDTIGVNMEDYENELLDLAAELEIRQVKKYLDENTRTYKFFAEKLTKEYEKHMRKSSQGNAQMEERKIRYDESGDKGREK